MTFSALLFFIWSFVKIQKWTFLSILLVSLVWALDATLWPLILQHAIDIFTQYDADRSSAWSALKVPAFYGISLWILVEIGFRSQGFLLAKALPKLESDIRMNMFEHIQKHSPRYFNEHFSGSLANKITDMTTRISLMLQELLTIFIPACVTSILGIFLFARINILFSILLTIWLVIHFYICIRFIRSCDKYQSDHAETRSSLLGRIVDSFTNNFAVNLFYRFAEERTFISGFQTKEYNKHRIAMRSIEIMRVWLAVLSFLAAGIGMNGLMIYFWLDSEISSGEVVQIFNTTWNIQQLIWIVGFTLPNMFQSLGIAKQAFSVMQQPSDIVDAPNAKPLVVTKGEIIFDNVSFHYGKKKLFQNKDVHIRGGEKVGLIGYSGAGKSTFVNLILRFFPLETGSILIDNQEISQVTLGSLRRQIALIPQDPILFHRSVKENILFGRSDASEKELFEAARLAHCDEFIQKMPQGYDTVLGERGTKLSGGERQRIAIARAILSNAPILILDEATSALDSVTEQYIQESLRWLMENRTTIVIAHRLSTLADMERILVFNEGMIVEEGTHEYLLAHGKHYSLIWSMQAGGFLPESDEDAGK